MLEETGCPAEITWKLPDRFAGDQTNTEFCLMRSCAPLQPFDTAETAAIRWADVAEARRLILKTTSTRGRARDLDVLEAVRRIMELLP